MPRGLYVVNYDLNGLTYHDTVLVCLPPKGVAFAFAHHIAIQTLPTAPCPGHTVMLLKEVLALPGDHVTVSSSGVLVNGQLLPNTVPVQHLDDGTPLPRAAVTVVPDNEVWTWTPAKRSYDSRYWGPMRVYARLTPAHIGPLALTFGKPE
jgi:conjugative transfer signal peptidase TraF